MQHITADSHAAAQHKKETAADKPTGAANKYLGIIYIIIAGFFFALMTLFVRLSGDLPVMQKAFFRNAVALVIAAIMVVQKGEHFSVSKQNRMGVLARAAFGTMGLICNFYAIDHMGLADANILNKLSPFFAIIMSVFILGEKANKAEWAAVAAAFIGALFVVKPSFQMSFVYALIGVLGGFGAGAAYTYVRKLGKNGVKGPVIVFWFSTFSCIATLPFVVLGYSPMSLMQLLMLVLAGIAAAGGQFAITAAYTKAPAREISVFDYTQVLFAALLGFIFFGQLPDSLSIIGYIIIIGSAVYKWWYVKTKGSEE